MTHHKYPSDSNQQTKYQEMLPEAATPAPTNIANVLNERGSNYGSFERQAATSESIKAMLHQAPNWWRLAPDQREALDMIAVKMGRLLTGNPDHHDGWLDISGYAKLVADRLEREQKNRDAVVAAARQMSLKRAVETAAGHQGEALYYPPNGKTYF